MTKRDVIKTVLSHRKPPYVPWQVTIFMDAADKLMRHYGLKDAMALDEFMDNHFVGLGGGDGVVTDIGNGYVRDHWGVTWNRKVDRDLGMPEGQVIKEPTLKGFKTPDPLADYIFKDVSNRIAKYNDRFHFWVIGFSLYERAWTLRGLDTLMMDFLDNPEFVHELLNTITDYNIAQIKEALKYDIDCVHIGDDWGQQHGLQMGPGLWREFIKPCLKRMFDVVRGAGKFMSVHSCGDVDEIFPDLIEIGAQLFNPFQPEAMDVKALYKQYFGKLAFHGGMSTQKTLPYAMPDGVRKEATDLLDMGRNGGYIFSPAQAVQGDVPLPNMVAFIEALHNQPGYRK